MPSLCTLLPADWAKCMCEVCETPRLKASKVFAPGYAGYPFCSNFRPLASECKAIPKRSNNLSILTTRKPPGTFGTSVFILLCGISDLNGLRIGPDGNSDLLSLQSLKRKKANSARQGIKE